MGDASDSFGQFIQRGIRLVRHFPTQLLGHRTDEYPRTSRTRFGSVSPIGSASTPPTLKRAQSNAEERGNLRLRLPALLNAAAAHRSSGLASVTGEHYEGGHWLGSFATYLQTSRGLGSK